MRQSQKMEALGRLAGGVAHDFNNGVMVINGLRETVLSILELDSPVREDLEEILAAGRAAGLTGQPRLQPQARALPTTFDLDETIGTMQPMLCAARRRHRAERRAVAGAEVDHRRSRPDRAGAAEPRRQCARRHAAGRRAAHQRDHRAARLRGRPRRALGAGSGAAARRHRPGHVARRAGAAVRAVFHDQARGKGTGLGLSTVYAIVAESGGRITVESHRGVGTTFSVALLLALPPEFAITGDPHPFYTFGLDPDRGTCTVLVVEDEAPVRHLVTSTLHRAGYTVLSAEDAASAMARLRGHAAPIDLLLTDVIMRGATAASWPATRSSSSPACRCCSCPATPIARSAPKDQAGSATRSCRSRSRSTCWWHGAAGDRGDAAAGRRAEDVGSVPPQDGPTATARTRTALVVG